MELSKRAYTKVSLNNSWKAKRLLEIAKKYLDSDWRYPKEKNKLTEDEEVELHHLIPVRVSYQRDGYNCGPVSLAMLISNYAPNFSDEIMYNMLKAPTTGVSGNELMAVAERLGYEATAKYNSSINDMLRELSEGCVVLINYQASYGPRTDNPREDNGHYSVVIAADENDILLVDPSYPSATNKYQLRIIPIKELNNIWWDTTIKGNKRIDRWMMAIHPKS